MSWVMFSNKIVQTVYFWQEFTLCNNEWLFKSGISDVWLQVSIKDTNVFYINWGEYTHIKFYLVRDKYHSILFNPCISVSWKDFCLIEREQTLSIRRIWYLTNIMYFLNNLMEDEQRCIFWYSCRFFCSKMLLETLLLKFSFCFFHNMLDVSLFFLCFFFIGKIWNTVKTTPSNKISYESFSFEVLLTYCRKNTNFQCLVPCLYRKLSLSHTAHFLTFYFPLDYYMKISDDGTSEAVQSLQSHGALTFNFH